MGAYRKLHFWKKFIECFLIHAVDISTYIHSNHNMVFVGLSRVACYWKFEVFPLSDFPLLAAVWLTNLSIFTLGGGFGCRLHFHQCECHHCLGDSEQGWLSRCLFSCSGILCENLQFYGSLCTWHSWLDISVLASVPVFHISCCSCLCSVYGHLQQNLWMYWNLAGIDSCIEHCNILFLTVALESPL